MRRFFLIIFGSLFSANLLSWKILRSGLAVSGAEPYWQTVLAIFMGGQILGLAFLIGGRLVGHQPGSGMGKPLLTLVMIWNMLLLLPITALAILVAAVYGVTGGWTLSSGSLQSFLGILAVFSGPLLAFVATGVSLWQLERFRINRLTLHFATLPPGLDGLTIAHLSDLHVGKLTNGRILDKITEGTNALKPDLILITGDLINMSLSDLPRAIEVLQGMKARHGLFLCEGNHDLIQDASGFIKGLRTAGINLLLNEQATVPIGNDQVCIMGVRWGQTDHSFLQRAKTPETFQILLAHHPHEFENAVAEGIPLTLAGHTHGGQLMLTRTFGFGSRLYRYWSGHYQKGSSQLVVSNGTGNWFPLRINAPAEIIHLTLRRH